MTFTFKKFKKETGLRSVGQAYGFKIKMGGKEVGWVTNNGWQGDGTFRIWFSVVTEDGWKNIKLKANFDTEAEARDWLKANFDVINNVYTLYQHED